MQQDANQEMGIVAKESYDEDDETQPNFDGFFSDLKTTVNSNCILYLSVGSLFSASGTQSEALNRQGAVRITKYLRFLHS